MNITILGTSHIAKESINEIKKAILEDKPDIVAVELDIQRATALLQKTKNKVNLRIITQIGVQGYVFVKIGQYLQQKLGKMAGVAPGSEMKTAIELAHKQKLEVALIDQPIQITLKKLSKSFTWKEKFRLFFEIIKAILQPKKQIKELGLENFDLSKVPKNELIIKMMRQLKKKYPSLYKTLVEDRNKYMIKNLIKLMRKHPDKKILAVVGAGHKEGMEKLLLKIDIVR